MSCLLNCNYKTLGQQTALGVVGGFSMLPLQRIVKQCTNCGKLKYIGLDIATTAHNDENLNWLPKLNEL